MQEGHCLGDQVLGFCNRRELRPMISFRSAQLETIQSLVAAGMGISLIPAMAVGSEKTQRPSYHSLSGERPERKIIAAWPRQRPLGRGSLEFLKILTEQLKSRGSKKR
jgi:LysR family hydrogen peroxide-inducible transcriptional activator